MNHPVDLLILWQCTGKYEKCDANGAKEGESNKSESVKKKLVIMIITRNGLLIDLR